MTGKGEEKGTENDSKIIRLETIIPFTEICKLKLKLIFTGKLSCRHGLW